MAITVGTELPNINLYENNPGNKVNIRDLFNGKKGIIFGVPGAFTPGCSKSHLPGFVESHDSISQKGYEVVACVSVNDPFVMEAWGKAHNADNKVRLLADTNSEFTKAIGMDKDMTAVLGSVRSKRYTLVVENNVVKQVFEEPDGTGLTCSLASNVIKHL